MFGRGEGRRLVYGDSLRRARARRRACARRGSDGNGPSFLLDVRRHAQLKVAGTVAKIEWTNPHAFVWVYVPNAKRESGYDLYAFENGPPNALAREGWSKTTFATGEPVTIEYWPLLDGRTGGHFASATRADGSVVRGVGGPANVRRTREPAAPAGRSP